jgi:IclR family transcriptional regulator, KDG regulon repressor
MEFASTSPYQVQVLDRAVAILEILSQSAEGLTLAQISQTLNLHKSTAHRLTTVLDRHRLVERTLQAGRYRLGLKLFELGTRAASQADLRSRARRFLERVSLETGETVHLCVYDDGEIVYLDKVEPARSVRLASAVGRRCPAYCTAVGKALMAFLPETQVDDAIRKRGLRPLTGRTVRSIVELKAELARVRRSGFALDNEENEEGVCCVGGAVRDFSGDPIAAISASGPTFRISREKIPLLARAVISAAGALSKELGFREFPALKSPKPQTAM